ncbi:ABC transporter permease [Spirosoma knui]
MKPQLPTPPRVADRLLEWFVAPHLLETLQGDLHEEFAYQVERVGVRRAQWRYWRDVLGFVRPYVIKRERTENLNPTNTDMIRNHIIIAFRQLWKNQLLSGLNIVGLTVGLAVSTLITLYVWHEFHYDRFQPFADRTYRITSVARYGGDDVTMTGLHESFGREAKRQIPDVEAVIRFSDGVGDPVLQSDPQHRFKESNIGFTDTPALSSLGFRLIYGNPKTALGEPGRIVLTRQLAQKYYGDRNPLGQTLLYDKQYPLTVSGVLDDYPTHSVIQVNGLISLSSMPTLGPTAKNIYESAGFLQTFLVLRPGTNIASVEKKLEQVKGGIHFVDMTARFFLEALPDLHLDSRGAPKDTRQSIYILLTIVLLILALAIINYVSLTTARATQRSREVGIRKAVGSQRSELIGQFFIESFLTTTIAFGLSLVVLQVLFPWANQALDLRMDNRVLQQGTYWGLLAGLWLACALLAGGYPALLLSRFKPNEVLKGTIGSARSGAGVRQFFTTLQFTASVALLICSLVLFMQMRLLRTQNLGINRSQVVSITIDSDMTRQFPAFRDAVRQWAGPDNVAYSNTALFTNRIMTWFMKTAKTQKQLMVNAMTVDKSFFAMMGVRMIYPPVGWQDRPVTKELQLYNQTVMNEAGIKGNPIQQPAPFKDQPTDGVVADFHVHSLRGLVSPMLLTVISDTSRKALAKGGFLLVRLGAQTDVMQALDHLRQLYNQTQPSVPFDYYFLDEAYNRLYEKEERLMRLFNGFTGLTLLVACLGLLGLMTFSVEVRTKEIGIRKVLGASVSSLVTLLSKDFLKLVLLAILIASPIAWYAMDQWLQNFAYKITIEWWMFALAGALATLVALLTVSFQSIRAALMDPAKSLRSE